VLDTQFDPLVNQTFEPLVGHGLTAHLLYVFQSLRDLRHFPGRLRFVPVEQAFRRRWKLVIVTASFGLGGAGRCENRSFAKKNPALFIPDEGE
jgi:hypothetical protein